MPNRNVHVPVGMVSGFAYSLYLTRDQQGNDRFLESIGGLVGGYWGGRLPDVLEPANSSMHRAFAHSTTTGASLVVGTHAVAQEWAQFFREKASHLQRRMRMNPMSEGELTINLFFEIVLRISAGLLPGLMAGYASHLALDACTPRSLPLA